MSKSPADVAVGSTVTFKAGPQQVSRTGEVLRAEGQFVVVKVGDREMKTRPGAIIS